MTRRAAGFVLFRHKDGQVEYLMLKAAYGDNHWSPPKGLVDPGEDDFATALRETQEEARYGEMVITVKTTEYIHKSLNFHRYTPDDLIVYKDQKMELRYEDRNQEKTVVYWLAQLRDAKKTVRLSEEHLAHQWVSAAEAIHLVGHEDFRFMIEQFEPVVEKLVERKAL